MRMCVQGGEKSLTSGGEKMTAAISAGSKGDKSLRIVGSDRWGRPVHWAWAAWSLGFVVDIPPNGET